MSKLVPGTDVDFGVSTTQADGLEAVVAPATGGIGTSNYQLENMKLLAEKIKGCFGEYYKGSIWQSLDVTSIAEVLPYALTLTKQENQLPQINLQKILPAVLRPFLEDTYGAALAQSGIYEAIGLDKDAPIEISSVLRYFPEYAPLIKLNAGMIKILANPYQSLLTLPVEHRAFFTGALAAAKIGKDMAESPNFLNPLTLKDILTYAQTVGEVPKVREYVVVYQTIP